MAESTQDRIDRYIRREMTDEESLYFEQDALNDKELRKELGLTFMIRKSLASRQRKLDTLIRWKYRDKKMLAGFVGTISVAAMLAAGFLLLAPDNSTYATKERIAKDRQGSKPHGKNKQDKVTKAVKSVLHDNNDAEIVETIEDLERQNAIPSINEISDFQYMDNKQQHEGHDGTELIAESYELHWMKICSLLRIGKKDEALRLLKEFATLDGEYKTQADSLLTKIEK